MPFELPRLALAVDEDGWHEDAQQHGGKRGGDRPVAVAKEFQPQDLPDHRSRRRAEQIRNDELADDRNETEEATRDDARQRQRDGQREKRKPRRGAEIGGGFEQRL